MKDDKVAAHRLHYNVKNISPQTWRFWLGMSRSSIWRVSTILLVSMQRPKATTVEGSGDEIKKHVQKRISATHNGLQNTKRWSSYHALGCAGAASR